MKILILSIMILNIIAFTKLNYIYYFNTNYVLNMDNTLDRLIIRQIIMLENKKKDIILFILFNYILILLTSLSLKSIEMSAKIYNILKFIKLTKKTKTIYKILMDETSINYTENFITYRNLIIRIL